MDEQRPSGAAIAQPNPDLPTPLYYQVASALREQILSGRLPPGELVPPEVQLATQLGVSRQTVREAIGLLVRNGLLVRRRGKGTFVALPRIEQDLARFYSFSAAMRSQGLREETHLVGWDQVPVGIPLIREIAMRLGVNDPDVHVLSLCRLRFVEGSPFLLETIYFPPAIAQAILRHGEPAPDLVTLPVYEILQRCAGLVMTRAHETLYPTVLDEAEARHLQVESGMPAFRIQRIAYAGAQPVEWRESLVRGDRAAYTINLAGYQNGRSLEASGQLIPREFSRL